MPYKSDVDSILDSLPQHHDGKFGYVVYRVSYGNNERWGQFLKQLDAFVQARLSRTPANQKLKEHFIWDIREDEAELNGASKDAVRRIFHEWVRSVNGPCNVTRYTVCLYADEEVINSVIEDEVPGDSKPRANGQSKAFVKLINRNFDESPIQYSEQEIRDREQRERMNAGDEGFPPIEGCKRGDVGWVKTSAKWLAPSTYLNLMDGRWFLVYVRPPKVSNGGG